MIRAFEREKLMVRMQGFMGLSSSAVYVCAALLLSLYLLLLPRAYDPATENGVSTAASLQHQAMNFPPHPPDAAYDPH